MLSIKMGWCLSLCFLCINSVAFAVSKPQFGSKLYTTTKDDSCSCPPETICVTCGFINKKTQCARSKATDPFKKVGTHFPYNKYAFLTTHNSFSIGGERSRTGIPRFTLINQDETIAEQLKNGVRALMLDTYDFRGDVWLCHSLNGKCYSFTAFRPARETFVQIEAFLSANPSEIVTLILEDYVKAPNGLTNLFKATGLVKYWFPLAKMPRQGGNWPSVNDMIAANQRLVVFTSVESKEKSEGIAYQWNFMVENQFGYGGMHPGNCPKRNKESAPIADTTKSLVLINYFPTFPFKQNSCKYNSNGLLDMLHTCHAAAGNRWANFIAVDYFERSKGGGVFQALDMVNGQLLCGREDINQCLLLGVWFRRALDFLHIGRFINW